MSLPNNYEVAGQLSIFDVFNPDLWYGKTSPERSAQIKAMTSLPSSKKRRTSSMKMPLYLDLRGGSDGRQVVASWAMGGALLGEYTTHSFGEYPNEERESLLSQILETTPHPKYCLSARACQGILNRAEKRGKELPEQLKAALIRQSLSKSEPEKVGGVKEFSYNTKEPVPSQHSTINPCLGLDRASFNQGQNAQYDFSVENELAQTIMAKGPGGVLTTSSEASVHATQKE